MILGLTAEEKNEKLQKILMTIMGAIEAGDAEVWEFDIDLHANEDEAPRVDVSFTVYDQGGLIDVLAQTLWGKEE